ncbi:PREDICTED: facilitated trehalose transporter Tret1-like [Papilio polytes]|uniref:facilitated trehalose transporter Tret1-like n=1 Tax=Papilio polytes TaxID=76194 RepID=UPI000675C9BC|nr:PREDICTED: facilitated trehalose transporter Tret1-like [Papilio polytes]
MLSGSQAMTFCYVLLPQLNAISPLDDERASWIASINGVSLPIGLLITTPMMNTYGRKPANMFRAILATVAWICLSLTSDYYVILFCRFLQGICLGCAAILVPVLLGEYSSPKKGNYDECRRIFNWLRYPNEGRSLVLPNILAVAYGLLVSLLILPETKDKTLQDIEEEFKGVLKDRELNNLIEKQDLIR